MPKGHTKHSRSFYFLTGIHRIMNEMTDLNSDTLAPPSNASRLKCRDSQILITHRDRIGGVTKWLLCFRFFWFFFGTSDLKRL